MSSDEATEALLLCYLDGNRLIFRYLRRNAGAENSSNFATISKPYPLNLSNSLYSLIPGYRPSWPMPVNYNDNIEIKSTGALTWQDGLAQLQMVVVVSHGQQSSDASNPRYKAFVLELAPTLVRRRQAGRLLTHVCKHPDVNGRLFATVSPFFQPIEHNLLVPDANDSYRELAYDERKWPRADDRFAALCCRKDSGDRDFSVPARGGTAYLTGYRPSADWFASPVLIPNGPRIDNRGTGNVGPQQLIYLDNSTTVFALYTPFPDDNSGQSSSRVITLGFTSATAMGRLTSTSTDTRWSLLNITSGSHGFRAACAVAVQPPDPSAPPLLYIFAVDSNDNNQGRLWYMTLPLCGYDSMYGHPKLEPGTTTIEVGDQAASNSLEWVDDFSRQPINAEPTRPLKVVRYGNSLGVFHQVGGEIRLLRLDLQKDGSLIDPAFPQFKHMYRQYTKVTSENSAMLVSACAMPLKFCNRFV
ncbi:uncharacterized protein CCOS01_14484 [Colletotrichum costaricense]|uniref:Uncharacterized protein n=1 Tax=Colletotrichum costaricense TaxID=1209916 RepID=A0AAI9YK26_9PEZI|nr:uncharacterized protein CCOS01_14484 [Colletotrichum costaricense]KAK1513542.1 hypothetical protein CCOS01_14484 [Colletotrichum costaricense]